MGRSRRSRRIQVDLRLYEKVPRNPEAKTLRAKKEGIDRDDHLAMERIVNETDELYSNYYFFAFVRANPQ
jgi:hypothetical protein